MMLALTLVYVADTLPMLIVAFGNQKPPTWCENLTDCGYNWKSIALSSYYLNSMANAFVYGFFSVKFRENFKDLFRARRRKPTL
ncbi:hypothetical protein V1264_000535 [Littorina saxatilis]|uniref:G-protein coupled receptors family 1 profile domain-containing protein n=2 Tax=Littorina saxatilis TaxID=31220 RepID=A0AAN9C018_9CAEN